MRLVVAAAVAGVAFALAFPPAALWWLAIPAVTAFLWAIRRAPGPGTAWLIGAGFGLSAFGVLFPWLTELGWIAFVPLWLVEAAFFPLYARLLWPVQLEGGAWIAVAAGGWGVMEWARGHFPLGGFPWGMVGFPLGDFPPLRGTARWIGTSGVSMLGVALAAAVVVVVRSVWAPSTSPVDPGSSTPSARPGRVGSAWVSSLVVLLAVAGFLYPAIAGGDVVRVAVVQGSTPCPGSHCENERLRTYQSHLGITRTLEPGSVDLVVWPEGSTGGVSADPVLTPEVGQAIAAEAERLGAVMVVGGDRPVSDTEWVNANVVFGPDGTMVGEYLKRHPVPFGEYVPARDWFTWIDELSAVPRDMLRGQAPMVVDLGFGPFGSVISFEGAFARYPRDTVLAGARLLVVATNQGSYPFSPASDQFIRMTRMRSAELGIDVVHAAVTGRSTLITDGGRIGETTPLGEPALLLGEVRMRDGGLTLYARLGDWLVLLGGVGAAVLVAVDRDGRRERRPQAQRVS